MVRTMLESLVSNRTTPKGKKSLRTHLSDAHIAEIEQFHAKSFYWSYLLNLSGIYSSLYLSGSSSISFFF
jgi:hypothetical protein